MRFYCFIDTPKSDGTKKPPKIEITIKPQNGTELRNGIKVYSRLKIESSLSYYPDEILRNVKFGKFVLS